VGHDFNINSPLQLSQVLFMERHLKPVKKIKTGYSTDSDTLEALAAEDEVPALVLRWRFLSKLKSTYVDTLPALADKDGRVHTTFVQTGTATGRLSSRDPNLQNIPVRENEGRRIREAFCADEGNLLVSADYSQIELVVMAHLSGDVALARAFQEGKDVHAHTAALVFGVDETAVTAAQRRMAKVINFGVIYGKTAFTLAKDLNISRSDAAAFIDAYFKTYAGVRGFLEKTIRFAEEHGYVETLFGRRRYIPAINSANRTEKAAAEREARNAPIQGTAADIMKKAMLLVSAALSQRPELGARLLLQIHDELLLECPAEKGGEVGALVKSTMENAVHLAVPLRVSVETGKSWGEFH
jgi:DNA polymerase-1